MLNVLKKVSLLKMALLFTAVFVIFYYFGTIKVSDQLVTKAGSVEALAKSSNKEIKNALKENKNTGTAVNNKIQSTAKFDNSPESKVNATARVLRIDEDHYQVMKEDYFCDLAITARENCELQLRSEESMEICLKMGGYFTNSRHCGYQP